MGKKKYTCEFCNRSFNDDPNTRKKHFSGTSHIKSKKEHYDLFRDPETILKEESAKKPCRRFQNEGYCPFGGSCLYSHYSQSDLEALRYEAEVLKMKKEHFNIPTIDSWLSKRTAGAKLQMEKQNQISVSLWSHELPYHLKEISAFLPPSLQPFNIAECIKEDVPTWG